ncbi:Hypothetical predicted protein [Mytilus galloprovincialis]|uniref:Uncharacterized protein n=1 Tax=Mytilus galloprovincialis TaxID=29158 RepID=A0A8B6EUE6_MYTGA|nr:Hypothetical predicted protein [Mytilus galloprovincialis]
MLCGFLAVVVIPTFVFACCPPKQWEGIEYTALGSTGADGKTHYTEIFVLCLVLDRTEGISRHGPKNGICGTIYGCRWGKCNAKGPSELQHENATAVLKSYMGAGNSKIMTTVYKYVTGMSTSYITMADDGCIPMAYEAAGQNADGGGYQMTVEFFGITPGIADTSVFNEPAQCGANVPAFAGIGVGRR